VGRYADEVKRLEKEGTLPMGELKKLYRLEGTAHSSAEK
jgi:hypothetical protein